MQGDICPRVCIFICYTPMDHRRWYRVCVMLTGKKSDFPVGIRLDNFRYINLEMKVVEMSF